MPRDGSGNYRKPFPDVEEDTTIESAVYNGFTDDVAIDLNAPRPITSGGTGAANVRDALINLTAEASKQLIVNYDSHPFLPGSFYSLGAVNDAGPVSGHKFIGICYVSDLGMVLEARDQSDTVIPGRLYVREKKPGDAWSLWKLDGRFNSTDGGGVDGISSEAADMFYGVRGTAPNSGFVINSESDATGTDVFQVARNGATAIFKVVGTAAMQLFLEAGAGLGGIIWGRANSLARWAICMGNGTTEGAGNTGNDFTINRYDNAGTYSGTPFSINRSDGVVTANGGAVANQTWVTTLVNSYKPFQAGTMLLFHMNTPPVGWTKYTGYTDRILRITNGTIAAGGTNALSTFFAQGNTGITTLSAWATPGGLSVYGENTFTVYPGGNSNAYFAYAEGGWGNSGPNGGGGVPFLVGWGQINSSSGYNGLTSSGGGSGGYHSHPMMTDIQYVDVIFASRDA